MPYVTICVEADEVLPELRIEDLRQELERREKEKRDPQTTDDALLKRAYEHFRRTGGCPDVLREYFWNVLGRAL